MKTKLILIAVITLVGIGLLTAFKQSEGNRKYLLMSLDGKDVYIVDENGVVTEKKTTSVTSTKKMTIDLCQEINVISSKGYKLNNVFGSTLIFEKE